MGTYIEYTGAGKIPESKKQEFNENMQKLLQRGGMVQFDPVRMFGKQIALIRPVEFSDAENEFHYNYFEDDSWESAYFFPHTQILSTQKIGSAEFNEVIAACYFLYELYCDDHGCVKIDEQTLNNPGYIGWINFVLGTKFSMKKRFDLWEYYETEVLDIDYNENTYSYIFDVIPNRENLYMGGTDLADIIYAEKGTEQLEKGTFEEGSYPAEIQRIRKLLQVFYMLEEDVDAKERESRKRLLWRFLGLPMEARTQMAQKYPELQELAEASATLPARVFVYLSAELLDFDFWGAWRVLRTEVYKDEIRREYVNPDIVEERKFEREKPVKPMRTSDFLYVDDFFSFYKTPEELKGKPDYHISDDDLLYWWDGSDAVKISDAMEAKMEEWRSGIEEIEAELSDDDLEKFEMLQYLINILSEADKKYQRIFAFQNMFYDFIEHKDRKHVAAIQYLQKVLDDNWECGKIIEKGNSSWWAKSRNVTFNQGRVTVKRYLSLLANKTLRAKYLGF